MRWQPIYCGKLSTTGYAKMDLTIVSRQWAAVLRFRRLLPSNPTKLIEAAEITHARKRDRRFESISLQQRVYKPSVPERRTVDDAVMMEWRVAVMPIVEYRNLGRPPTNADPAKRA